MSSRSLQEDLLRIPGVEGAEIEGSGDKPAGLRIRIAEGADQRAVGGAIRRVLTAHGLGTDTQLPGEPDFAAGETDADVGDREAQEAASAELEEQASTVAVLDEDVEQDSGEGSSADASVIDLTDRSVPASDDVAGDDGPVDVEADAADVVEDAVQETGPRDAPETESIHDDEVDGPGAEGVEDDDAAILGVTGFARIESVAVQEGRDGIVVTVTASDGSAVRQVAASTEGGVEAAVVKATSKLAMPDAPEAVVIEIEDRRIQGIDLVMIVLDVNGRMAAGSSVVAAGRSFALGRATWAALSL